MSTQSGKVTNGSPSPPPRNAGYGASQDSIAPARRNPSTRLDRAFRHRISTARGGPLIMFTLSMIFVYYYVDDVYVMRY